MPKVELEFQIEPELLKHMLRDVVATGKGFRCVTCFKDVKSFTLHHDANGNTRSTWLSWVCEGDVDHASR